MSLTYTITDKYREMKLTDDCMISFYLEVYLTMTVPNADAEAKVFKKVNIT